MKVILAIIAASCIVVCTKALSCYQCHDAAAEYDSADEMMAQKVEQEMEVDAPPNCDASNMTPCSDDTHVCGDISISYSASMSVVTMTAEMVSRSCVPPLSGPLSGVTIEEMEQFYCNKIESVLANSSDSNLDFKSCKLDVCSTDNCNTQGMEKFHVSSETKPTISFLLILLVSFLAVVLLLV